MHQSFMGHTISFATFPKAMEGTHFNPVRRQVICKGLCQVIWYQQQTLIPDIACGDKRIYDIHNRINTN